jgi:hypothetical protein
MIHPHRSIAVGRRTPAGRASLGFFAQALATEQAQPLAHSQRRLHEQLLPHPHRSTLALEHPHDVFSHLQRF